MKPLIVHVGSREEGETLARQVGAGYLYSSDWPVQIALASLGVSKGDTPRDFSALHSLLTKYLGEDRLISLAVSHWPYSKAPVLYIWDLPSRLADLHNPEAPDVLAALADRR